MAALTITVADLALEDSLAKVEVLQYGEAVTPGQSLYLNADGKYYLADADAAATADASRIALTYGAADEWGVALLEGDLQMGAILISGTTYYASPTAGGIGPAADLLAGDTVTIIGTATSTSVLQVKFNTTGAVV
jgi:hypothetical protein